MASKKKFSTKDELGDEELEELLNDPEKLAAVLDKKPPVPPKSKSGQKETATLARERQNMRSNKSTSTREVLERMLQKNPGLTRPFPHFVDDELHTVFPAKEGNPAYWFPIAKRTTDEEASTVRQSDRSSRDAISDTHEETEQKETENDGDNWDDEAEIDNELQLNNLRLIIKNDQRREIWTKGRATRITHKRQGIKCASQTTLRTKEDNTTIASPVLSQAKTGDSRAGP